MQNATDRSEPSRRAVLTAGVHLLVGLPSATAAGRPRDVLDRAERRFFEAWRTGHWEPLLALLADDLVFQFPVGPHRGRHLPPHGKARMTAWAREHGAAGNRILTSEVDLRVYGDDWIAVCDRGTGTIGGTPYEGLHAIFMRARDDRIVEYREYMGDIA